MIKEIIFEPAKESSRDLIYREQTSCDHSLYLLLQDSSTRQYPFLLRAYRAVVSSYLSCERLEGTAGFLKRLVEVLEGLAQAEHLAPGDLKSLGLFLLVQERDSFWLLCSNESEVYVRLRGSQESISAVDPELVSEISLLGEDIQKELFPSRLRDCIKAYRITPGTCRSYDIVLGCTEGEKDSVFEALDDQPILQQGPKPGTVLLETLGNKVMAVSVAEKRAAPGSRGGVSLGRQAGFSQRSFSATVLLVVFMAVVLIGGLWGTQKFLQPSPPAPSKSPSAGEASLREGAVPEAPTGGQGRGTESGGGEVVWSLSPVWEREFSEPVTSSPLLCGAVVIFGCRDRNLYALDRDTGKSVWTYRSSGGIGASPAGEGESVFCADYKGEVFCLNIRDGRRKWVARLPMQIVSSPLILGDGVVVGCFNRMVYCLSCDDGKVLWKYKTGGLIRGSPAAGSGLIFLPSYDGYFYALSLGSGSPVWKSRIGGRLASSPASSGSLVVVGGPDGFIYALAAEDGSLLWKRRTGGPVKSNLFLTNDRVYAGSNDSTLYCLDASSGSDLWKFRTEGIMLSRPALWQSAVVVGSYDGKLYVLDSISGKPMDSFATGAAIYSSPAVGGGRVFFGNNGNKFFCLKLIKGRASS